METIRSIAMTALGVLLMATLTGKTDVAMARTATAADLSSILELQDDRYGEDSVACVRNWSLYAEYYRQRNYEMAYEPWKYMFDSCPRATQNIYIHGANMIKHFYNTETDPDRREAWVDTLMMIYDQRIEMFGEEGRILGRKAADLYQLRPSAVQELYEMTERSIELEGMSAGADVLLINFQSTIRLADAALLEPEAILQAYERATNIIEYNLEHNPDDARFYNPAKNNIRAMFEPYATCDNLIAVYGPRFEANPDDIELLERITQTLDNARCTEEELFYETTKKLHEIRPEAESAFLMGRLETNRENHREAIRYYQQAADLFIEENEQRNQDRIFRAYWLMAEISFRQFGELTQARRYARQAHQVNPADGRPLIMIGEMYAESADECGDDDVTKKAAFWTAVDKFNEAARVAEDEAVKSHAEQLANTFRQYFPNNEEIFFHGYSVGETFRVECWINRDTRIRAR